MHARASQAVPGTVTATEVSLGRRIGMWTIVPENERVLGSGLRTLNQDQMSGVLAYNVSRFGVCCSRAHKKVGPSGLVVAASKESVTTRVVRRAKSGNV
jgi:uncharacterized transporter YbjL